jgi:hypothetical protein
MRFSAFDISAKYFLSYCDYSCDSESDLLFCIIIIIQIFISKKIHSNFYYLFGYAFLYIKFTFDKNGFINSTTPFLGRFYSYMTRLRVVRVGHIPPSWSTVSAIP